jgi:hypothetical protein
MESERQQQPEALERVRSFWRRRKAAHRALSIILPILPGHLQPLEQLLKEIGGPNGGNIQPNPHIDFSRLTTTHFLRWLIVQDEPHKPRRHRELLVFESNFDRGLENYLAELVAVAGQGLREIYQHCGYPAGEAGDTDAALCQFLRAASTQRYATFYQAYPHLTAQRIRSNAALRECIEEVLDAYWQHSPRRSLSPDELEATSQHLQERIQQCLAARPELRPEKAPPPHFLGRLLKALARKRTPQVVLTVCLLPIIAPAGLLALIASLILLRKEQQDEAEQRQHRRALEARRKDVSTAPEDWEDFQFQNQLTHMVELKQGVLRWLVLHVVLGSIHVLSRHLFIHGKLGELQNIHFASWRFFEGRRLLFCSNYDGSWESYLGDFIERASVGLNSIWCNTRLFPMTGWLFKKGGACQEEDFKQWTRQHQLPTLVWYSAHPDKSVRNILEDQDFCSKIESMAPAELGEWLSRF